jgi:hypothetical protein
MLSVFLLSADTLLVPKLKPCVNTVQPYYLSSSTKGGKKNQGTQGLKFTAPILGIWFKARVYQSFDLTKVYDIQPLNFKMEVRIEKDF